MSTTVTGTLQNPDTTAAAGNTFARFWLRGCNGGQPRVNGTALIAPDNGPTYFVDLVPNASGVISGTLYSNDVNIDTTLTPNQHPTWYGVQIYTNGIGGAETSYNLADGVTFNLNSATPITTIPVITPPTGDTTYARLDGGNMPFTGQVVGKNGVVGSPGFAFASDLTSGFYRIAASRLGLALAGANAIDFQTTITKFNNGPVSATTGYQVNNVATTGHVLRGNGTNFVDAALAAADLSNGVVGSGAVVLATAPSITNETVDIINQPAATAFLIKDNQGGTRYSIPSGGAAQATLNNTNVTGGSTLTNPTITGTPTGTGIPTVTLKKGSGGGNYTSASTTYVVVDSTNLCYTVTIPTGWKLLINAAAEMNTATAAVSFFLAISDNAACGTANAGIIAEVAAASPAIATELSVALTTVINGDGNSHSIALQYKTSVGADAATIVNSSATRAPMMTFLLTPSN